MRRFIAPAPSICTIARLPAGHRRGLTGDGQATCNRGVSDGSLIAFHSTGAGGWVMPGARWTAATGRPRMICRNRRGRAMTRTRFNRTAVRRHAKRIRRAARDLNVVDVDGSKLGRYEPASRCRPRRRRRGGDGRFVASGFDGARNNGVWVVAVASGDTARCWKRSAPYARIRARCSRSTLPAAIRTSRLPFDKRQGRSQGRRRVDAVPGVEACAHHGVPMAAAWVCRPRRASSYGSPLAPDGTQRGAARR